jgi:capsular polysaccharide transport system ATP-binding protein
MSIDLIGVTHRVQTGRSARRLEFRDINMHIEDRQRVALLGKKGDELDELVNMICGAVVPSRGHVVISSEISWPIGETGFMSNGSTLATNLRFVARIYETDDGEYADRVGEVAEIQKFWNEKLGACSKDIKWRFAFALGVCLPFDIYIFQTTEPSDKTYRERCQAIVEELGREYGLLLPTTKGEVAQKFCDRAFVLDGGKVTYYEDIEAAIAHLDRLEEPAVAAFGDGVDEVVEEDNFDII